jgi:hypothetical protein
MEYLMGATKKATKVVSVEELREQALRQMYSTATYNDEEYVAALKKAKGYVGVLEAVNGYLAALPRERLIASRGPLMAICDSAAKQLARIEREHASLTSLASLRDQAAGIIKVYGPYQGEELTVGLWEAETYGQLDAVIASVIGTLVERGYEKGPSQLQAIRAFIESNSTSSG